MRKNGKIRERIRLKINELKGKEEETMGGIPQYKNRDHGLEREQKNSPDERERRH